MNRHDPNPADQAPGLFEDMGFHPEDPSAWSSRETLRLLLTPAIVTALLVGGIFWVKLQLPASRSSPSEASTVRVHLLTRPMPAPIPVAESSQTANASIAPRTDSSAERPDRPVRSEAVVSATSDPAPAEIAPANDRSVQSTADAPPDPATIKFQQALLHHVGRYQRYPKAARGARLYGVVGAIFSMRRDGTVLAIRITSSSGQTLFDKEAMDTIWRAQPLPAIPRGMPDTMSIQATLVFEPS